MLDPEFDQDASHRRRHPERPRAPRILSLAFVVWLGSYLLGFPGCSRIPYTCAVCRKDKVEHRCLGLGWSEQEETDCSLWYQANVERTHPHVWLERTHCRRFGIPGLYGGYACTGGGPLTHLSRTLQIKIYRHFRDPSDAKRLFIGLGRWDDEGHRQWDALMGWVEADFPGTWRDWWEAHRAPDKNARR
jgi:hypothetical protein